MRIGHIAEEIDVCPGKFLCCEETQLKTVILVGVCDEELLLKLLTLDTTPSLQDIVNTRRAHEATKSTTSAIRAKKPQVKTVSTYKWNKQRPVISHTTVFNTSCCLLELRLQARNGQVPGRQQDLQQLWSSWPFSMLSSLPCYYCPVPQLQV